MKLDRWICENLLYFKYTNEEVNRGLTGWYKDFIISAISGLVFINIICLSIIIVLLFPNVKEVLPFSWIAGTGLVMSLVIWVLLFMKYVKDDKFLLIAKNNNIEKKHKGVVHYFIVLSLTSMMGTVSLAYLLQ
ncbi:MAG: hypothetical protein ACI8Q1_002493 [Parvicella sp.]|jgi:hypothetical protein